MSIQLSMRERSELFLPGIEHVLFYCTRNAEAREELYTKVFEAMEADYRAIFRDMSNEHQKIIAM